MTTSIYKYSISGGGRVFSEEDVVAFAFRNHADGKKIAFTNGCFDLFHAGHLKTFKEAKKVADIVIVALNSDASIRRIKGEKRPVINQNYRAELLSALECVDAVVIFDDNSPANLIEKIKPDFYLKGADWKNKNLPEAPVVEKCGGQLHYVDLTDGLSTTKIIEKILNVYSDNGENTNA